MDFSRLDRTERTAAIGAATLVIAGLIAAAAYSIYGVTWLAILAGIAMLFVLFQPQLAPGVGLPGSRGSLALVLGGIAGAIMLLALLAGLQMVFLRFGLPDLFFLVAVAAALVMAWAGWQMFQGEGGRFTVGAPRDSEGDGEG